MQIKPGTIIRSSPVLEDENFNKAVIVITENNELGAVGFVINKEYGRTLNELAEFGNAAPVQLYAGGPVDKEHLFVLHRCPSIFKDSRHLYDDVYTAVDLLSTVHHFNNGLVNNNNSKLFIGYCGWDTGELENEIEEGSWQVVSTNADIVFKTGNDVWSTLRNTLAS